MTEVRTTHSSAGSGLFATKDYATGDVILREEVPIIRLVPKSTAHEQEIINTLLCSIKKHSEGQLKDGTVPTLFDCIEVPTSATTATTSATADGGAAVLVHESAKNHGMKFKAMVQTALCFVHIPPPPPIIDALLELYHPPLSIRDVDDVEEERAIVQLSLRVLDYLSTLTAYSVGSPLHTALEAEGARVQLQKVLLIWACNAFAGGRIYPTFSRINHSCDPNCVVVVAARGSSTSSNGSSSNNSNVNKDDDDDTQSLVAAAPIQAGDELCISYLGSLLYADLDTRRGMLARDKHFGCRCLRCRDAPSDPAQQVPCPVCHPREATRQLNEDVQYDDDRTVRYVCPQRRQQPKNVNGLHDCLVAVVVCDACGFRYREESSGGASPQSAPYAKLFQTNRTVVEKVVAFLRDDDTICRHDSDDGDDDEAELVRTERLEQQLRMASSVLGAKHWATNLLMLLQLDQTLAAFHANMLHDATMNDGSCDSAMEIVAEAIDMLERLVRFVDGLGLKLHSGHLLSDVVIGTARALVALGDAKSQRYAAQWLDTIADDYVRKFEPDAVQTVVRALQGAWQRTNANGSNRKRAKR